MLLIKMLLKVEYICNACIINDNIGNIIYIYIYKNGGGEQNKYNSVWNAFHFFF